MEYMSLCVDVWPKKSECQSKGQLSLRLISPHGLFALVFIWPSALLLWNREKFCLLKVLLMCPVWHVREHLACDCVFYKVYFICSQFNCLKNSCRGMDFQKLNGALALLGIVKLFWPGSKQTTRMGRIFKSRRKWNEKRTYCFCHPFSLLLLVALLCISLF